MERDGYAMSIKRSVNIRILTVMRDELMEISEWKSEKKLKRGFHDEEIKAKIKRGVFAVGSQGRDSDEEVTNDLGDALLVIVGHEEAVMRGKVGRCQIELLDSGCTDHVHLCAFVKHDCERMVLVSYCSSLKGTGRMSASKIHIANVRSTIRLDLPMSRWCG